MKISHCPCPACYLPIYLLARVLKEIVVLRFEMGSEAQDLKAVAITDGPELQLIAAVLIVAFALVGNDPARVTSNLIHGSIDALCPAT